jgi:glyoxylase-like metal-dependent hydrolase (beta-lactamase superfamily II)
MKITRVSDHLIQLTRFATVFPMNCYLVREDDGYTLVDTGMGSAAKAMIAVAQAQGAPIVRIALTHAHSDHVGSLDALHAALPGAEVSISARDARFLAGERTLDPDEPQVKLRGSYQTCTTRPDRLLNAGDRVGSLEVIAAPGHTPGQVAFLDRRDGALIAGDAFQTRAGIAVAGTVRPLFPFVAMGTLHRPTALQSARALRALNPTLLAVGHGAALREPLSAMDSAIAVAERQLGEKAQHAA